MRCNKFIRDKNVFIFLIRKSFSVFNAMQSTNTVEYTTAFGFSKKNFRGYRRVKSFFRGKLKEASLEEMKIVQKDKTVLG